MNMWRPTGRLASTVRGLVAIPLAFWGAHLAFRRFYALIPGLHGHPPHGHILFPGLLAAGDVRQIVNTAVAVSLLILTERGGWSFRRLIERSNMPRTARCYRQALGGAAVGFVSGAAIMLVLITTGCAHVRSGGGSAAGIVGSTIVGSTIVWAGVFVLVGVAEEFGSRGYALRSLSEGIGFFPAALLTSLWFGFLHLHEGDPWYGALNTAVFGFFAACTWRATGSLGFAIGYHAAWDYTQSVIFGVPDSSFTMAGSLLSTRTAGPVWLSGGMVGPEGSLVTYAQLLIMILIALRSSNGHAGRRDAVVVTA